MAIGKGAKRFVRGTTVVLIDLQHACKQGRDICRWDGLIEGTTKGLITCADIDAIALHDGVTLLHGDPEESQITLVMLCARLWATAQMNVDRTIEGDALYEVTGQLEGMRGRVRG